MIYTTCSRRFHCSGNNGEGAPRTAGQRAKTGPPLQPLYRPTWWQRVMGRVS
jgi:hypothetical protein